MTKQKKRKEKDNVLIRLTIVNLHEHFDGTLIECDINTSLIHSGLCNIIMHRLIRPIEKDEDDIQLDDDDHDDSDAGRR